MEDEVKETRYDRNPGAERADRVRGGTETEKRIWGGRCPPEPYKVQKYHRDK